MNDSDVLRELRLIRFLLTIGKEEEIEQRVSGISDIQIAIIERLDTQSWKLSNTGELADQFDCSRKTIQREYSDLVDQQLIRQKGERAGTKYQLTELGVVIGDAEILNKYD